MSPGFVTVTIALFAQGHRGGDRMAPRAIGHRCRRRAAVELQRAPAAGSQRVGGHRVAERQRGQTRTCAVERHGGRARCHGTAQRGTVGEARVEARRAVARPAPVCAEVAGQRAPGTAAAGGPGDLAAIDRRVGDNDLAVAALAAEKEKLPPPPPPPGRLPLYPPLP